MSHSTSNPSTLEIYTFFSFSKVKNILFEYMGMNQYIWHHIGPDKWKHPVQKHKSVLQAVLEYVWSIYMYKVQNCDEARRN